jgi:hypothetical protein
MSSYIDRVNDASRGVVLVNWRDFTHKRLCWLYGLDRAWDILKGRDGATLSDLESWNRLGRRDAA